MIHVVEMEVGGRPLRLETGRMAKQADGAVLATYADTVVLATAEIVCSIVRNAIPRTPNLALTSSPCSVARSLPRIAPAGDPSAAACVRPPPRLMVPPRP